MVHIEVGRGEKKMHQVISSQNHQRFGTLRRVLIPVLDQHTASVG